MAIVLFWILVVLPLVLMIASQVYAMTAQDARGEYLVVLTDEAPAEVIAQEHAKQFGLDVVKIWGSSSPSSFRGYSAWVPMKKVKALREDRRVARIEVHETSERSDVWHAEE